MAAPPSEETENLVGALYRIGVRHLARLAPLDDDKSIPPATLLRALAEHPESRLRSALILVFLRRTEFAGLVASLVGEMSAADANTLKLYYQAAVYLQQELKPVLRARLPGWAPLPDLFTAELGLPAAGAVSTEAGLQALGEAHARLTGWAYNWAGSYRQHVGLFVRQLGEAGGSHHG